MVLLLSTKKGGVSSVIQNYLNLKSFVKNNHFKERSIVKVLRELDVKSWRVESKSVFMSSFGDIKCDRKGYLVN